MAGLKIRSFDEVEVQSVSWLWKPYIAFGKVTVIQGDPGNGKTTLALALAALFSRHENMPTGENDRPNGNIIYQSGEDNPSDTIKPRLVACGADCSKIAFIEADEAMSFDMLEEAIIDTNAKFAVLDPLQSFLTEKQDISSTKNIRPIFTKLGSIAAKTGAAIVIIGHMNKGEKSKAIYRGLGSVDISAAARSVLLIGKRKDDSSRWYMTQIKNNLGAFGKTIAFTITENGGVEFLGECDVSDNELLKDTPKQSKYIMTRNLVTSMLETGDKRSNEIFDACLNLGVSTATIQMVKKKLGIKSVNRDRDWYWTLSQNENSEVDEDFFEEETDEIPVTFAEEILSDIPTNSENLEVSEIVKMSPFGEIRLIDWRRSNEP
jgi:archaellum biogenesis ATPase FlaH